MKKGLVPPMPIRMSEDPIRDLLRKQEEDRQQWLRENTKRLQAEMPEVIKEMIRVFGPESEAIFASLSLAEVASIRSFNGGLSSYFPGQEDFGGVEVYISAFRKWRGSAAEDECVVETRGSRWRRELQYDPPYSRVLVPHGGDRGKVAIKLVF